MFPASRVCKSREGGWGGGWGGGGGGQGRRGVDTIIIGEIFASVTVQPALK